MVGAGLALLLVAASLACWWLRRRYGYWSARGLAQAPVVWGFGSIKDALLGKKSTGQIFDEIYRSNRGKSAVGLYALLKPKLMVLSPELIQQVLVSEFSSFHDNEFYVDKKLDPYFALDSFVARGDEWKPLRAKIATLNTPSKIKEIFPNMKEAVVRLHAYIDQHLKDDFEAKELSTTFTSNNVAYTVFGISSDTFDNSDSAFRKIANVVIVDQLRSWWKVTVTQYFPKIRDLMGLSIVNKEVSDYIRILVKEVMEYRINNKIHRNDLFQYFMKKCMKIVVPMRSVHFDSQHWPDPDKFDPERFNEDVKSTRHHYTYLPFGEGPRICPGSKFGLTQVKLFIAALVLKYKILKCPRTPNTITYDKGSFMTVIAEDLYVRLEKI